MPAEIKEFRPKDTNPEQAGSEFYESAKVQAPKQERPFEPEYVREEHKAKVVEMMGHGKDKQPEASVSTREHEVSDQTQVFIDRLERSRTHSEALAILNEAMAAAQAGKIPPEDSEEIAAAAQQLKLAS